MRRHGGEIIGQNRGSFIKLAEQKIDLGGGAVGRGADLGGIVIRGVKAEARFDKTGTSVPFHLQPLQRSLGKKKGEKADLMGKEICVPPLPPHPPPHHSFCL